MPAPDKRRKLTDEQRHEAMWMRFVEKRSLGFIAARLGVTRQAVSLIVSESARETNRRSSLASWRRRQEIDVAAREHWARIAQQAAE